MMGILKSKALWLTIGGTLLTLFLLNRAPAKVRNFINNTAPAA